MSTVAGLLSAVVLLLAGATSYGQGQYDTTWARALELEQAGQYLEAIAELESLLDAYPQDYALILQLGWFNFEASNYDEAEVYYHRAIELSGGSFEGRLGLGWTLLRQERYDEAETLLEQLGDFAPDNTSVQQALAEIEAVTSGTWTTWFSGTGHIYGDHPDVTSGWGVSVGANGLIEQHLVLGVMYRFTRLAYSRSSGRGGRAFQWNQHEIFLGAGVAFPEAGLVAQYARIIPSLDDQSDISVAGISARYSPWGDIVLGANIGFFEETEIVRLAPSWSLPVSDWVSLRPGMALQIIDEEALWSGNLALVFHSESTGLTITGKLGEEEQTADLSAASIYSLAGRIRFGGSVEGWIDFDGWSLFGGYELAGLEVERELSASDLLAHWFGVGVSIRLPQ